MAFKAANKDERAKEAKLKKVREDYLTAVKEHREWLSRDLAELIAEEELTVEDVINKHKDMLAEIETYASILKDEARQLSVVGEERTLIDDAMLTVSVVGRKKWDPALIKKHLDPNLVKIIVSKVDVADRAKAEELLEANKIDAETAKKCWVKDTPAVTIKVK